MKRLLISMLIIWGLVLASPLYAGIYTPKDSIADLLAKAPALSTYNARAMVVLRDETCRLLPNGNLSFAKKWIVRLGPNPPAQWTEWFLPESDNIGVSDVQCKLFSEDGSPSENITPEKREVADGLKGWIVKIDSTKSSIYSLSWNEERVTKGTLSQVVRLRLDIPVWEQIYSFILPDGVTLYDWVNGLAEKGGPDVSADPSGVKHIWKWTNQPAISGGDIVKEDMPFLAVSLRSGLDRALQEIVSYQTMVDAPLPDSLRSEIKSSRSPIQKANFICKWLREKRLEIPVPPGIWRKLTVIKPEDRITPWEEALLLSRWLSLAGWDVKLMWLSAAPLKDDIPSAGGLFYQPVLRLSNPADGVYYYDPLALIPFDTSIPRLEGKELYSLETKKISREKIDFSSRRDNKCRSRISLKVDEKGWASGKMELILTGGWPFRLALLDATGKLEEERLKKFIETLCGRMLINPSIKIKSSAFKSSRIEVESDISGVAFFITPGSRFLAKIPSLFYPWINEIAGAASNGKIEFYLPFMLEQIIQMGLGKGLSFSEELPIKNGLEQSGVKYEESYTVKDKGKSIEIMSRLAVGAVMFEGDSLKVILRAMGMLTRWSDQQLLLVGQ